MELVIETYSALPCELKVFTINGITANQYDFGTNKDRMPSIAEPYGCGCRTFEADRHRAAACMQRYNITIDEFNKICDELEDKLYVGSCGWCI